MENDLGKKTEENLRKTGISEDVIQSDKMIEHMIKISTIDEEMMKKYK